jgi:predicted RNA-binding protein with TRAM domain
LVGRAVAIEEGVTVDVTIADATSPGRETARMLLAGVPSPVPLRDLIRFRVREEVARYNANPQPRFNGLVKPVDAEVTLNGYALARPHRLDWEKQAAVALEAFMRNGFFVFVGDRQVDDLDEELTLREADVVSFVRLVPLVGG